MITPTSPPRLLSEAVRAFAAAYEDHVAEAKDRLNCRGPCVRCVQARDGVGGAFAQRRRRGRGGHGLAVDRAPPASTLLEAAIGLGEVEGRLRNLLGAVEL
jgi:hypothetical protein